MLLHDLESPTGIFTDDNGQPCAGGLLLCLYPGTTVKKALYAADGTELANPATIGSDGYLSTQAFLGEGVSELQLYAPNFDGAVYDPDDFPGSDWRLVRSWQVRGSSAASGALPGIGSVAALQALDASGLEEGAVVAVSGYYASGDCPTRLFTLRDGTATGNGGTIFPALGGGRYWEWTPEGDVDVRTFGAVPGSNEDAVPSLISATAYANGADVDLWFLPGIYKVSSASLSVDGVKIEDGVSFLVEDAGDSFVLSVGKRYEIRLTGSARNASSAGKAKLDFSTCTASGKVRTSWNDGWGEVSGNGYSTVDWAGSQTLVVSTNVALSQDVQRIEVEAAAEVNGKPLGEVVNVGEVVSTGGQAVFAFGNFSIGKAYSSAMRLGRTTTGSSIAVLVDADWSISTAYPAPDYSGVVLYSVPNGGLVSVATTSDTPILVLSGVVSEEPIFGAVSIYAGGGFSTADSTRPLKARHFATLDADACKVVSVANGNVVDLEGRTATLSAPLSGATFKDGSVVIEDSTAWTNSASFLRCALSIGSSVTFGTPNPLEAREFSFVDCTTDAPIVLVGGISGFIATGNTYTGAGAALDVSGVTSWTGHAQVSDNSPEAVTRAPVSGYWPQTEGAARANPSGGASSSVNFGDAGTPHPGILYTGTTDAVLIPSSTFGRAVKVSGSTATNIKVETVDGSSFASGDIVSVYFNYSR